MGTGACPGSPLCLMNVSVFAEDPQSREFPLHHYSGLGTGTGIVILFFLTSMTKFPSLTKKNEYNP